MYMLRCSLFLSPLEGGGGYVRNYMNSVRDEREEKRWQGHKKFVEVDVAVSATDTSDTSDTNDTNDTNLFGSLLGIPGACTVYRMNKLLPWQKVKRRTHVRS